MITLESAHPAGPSEQIRAQLAAMIRSGELAEDAKLPTVRQLARDLRVAVGTVAKAYKELEAAGLVRTGRANGTRVNAGHMLAPRLLSDARVLASSAKESGMGLEELQNLVEAAWKSAQAT
ncbi:GntR family transcriptional regulator [Glutamicibacter arilaitensis]|uniref:GntR family transcriptional regulator n=1 Tax=Glutamicibacter arilaitensis TaxID=256701 RepID=UPI003FCEF4A0